MNEATDMTRSQETAPTAAESSPVRPPVDVCEAGDELTIWADMPGVSKDRLSVSVEGDALTIEGEASLDIPQDMRSAYAELRTPRYRRSFTLSSELDTDNIQASLSKGVLTLRIPKRAAVKPRRIEVSTG